MIDMNGIAAAIGVPCTVSGVMQEHLQLWETLYCNQAAWVNQRVRSLQIPAVVSRELKRLTLTEFDLTAADSRLQEILQRFLPKLRQKLDYGIASGGLLMKPCYAAGGIFVDLVPQGRYLPIQYTDDQCTAIACTEYAVMEKNCYTRIEIHTYENGSHTVENRCFRSPMVGVLGTPCSLLEVPQWASLLESITFPAEQPLFAVFQMPDTNNIDLDCPLGVSAFSDAVGFIRDADEQWERILWELESSERAIDASEDLFRFHPGTNQPILPKGRERMYHCLEKTGTGNTIFNTFSPEVRDTSYFNALNQILRRIESAAGLSYGTLSEVSDVEKTAEEIKSSKQRSFVRVSDIQGNLQATLEQLLYGFQYYRDYYVNRHTKPAEVSCTFGDGVLEDTDKEFQRRLQMVQARVLKPELLLSWYFGCEEAEALQMLPEQQDAGGLFDGGAF